MTPQGDIWVCAKGHPPIERMRDDADHLMGRPFDAAAIRDAVHAALTAAQIPPGQTHALALVVTPQGIKGVFSTKLGEHWTVDTTLTFDAHTQHVDGGAVIAASW